MELPLGKWIETILRIANAPHAIDTDTAWLRKRLDQLIKGTLPARYRFTRRLPPLGIAIQRDGLRLFTYLGPSDETELEEQQRAGNLQWLAEHHREALEGAIYALSADSLGTRVRRCDYCSLFFVIQRNHRRRHHFCCKDHRRAFDHAHRDRRAQADYMRRYRDVQRRRRKIR
jgi:hypothetical protein